MDKSLPTSVVLGRIRGHFWSCEGGRMGGERAPRDAWQALLGGVTREELAALSDADWDLIERRAVQVFAAVDRIEAVVAERDAGGAGAPLPAQRRDRFQVVDGGRR